MPKRISVKAVAFEQTDSVSNSVQAPLSMGFSRQEYWSGMPFPSPGDLLDPEIEPGSPAFKVDYFFFNFNFYFILLYNTVLVLPYIDMNPPRVYMHSQT